MNTHERIEGRQEEAQGGSDRAFGVVFTVVFALIALWPLKGGGEVRLWAAAVAGLFLLVALLRPALLAPLNRWWTAFGGLLQRIVHPIILGLLFFLVFTPIGLLLRLSGKDGLRLKRDPRAATYWIDRDPPGPAPEGMSQQF